MDKKLGLKRLLIKNNQGSAIVTVIVVCAFISIIATTMLYVSAKNYQTKLVDYHNKESFYHAEDALDVLKALLIEDVNDAFIYAYGDTMSNYVQFRGSINVDNYYAQSFTDRLNAIWNKREMDAGGDLTLALKKYMEEKLIVPGMSAEDIARNQDLIACIVSVDGKEVPPEKDRFLLVGIRASYTSSAEYSTYIYTDIGLELPKLDTVSLSESWGSVPETPYQEISITDCVKYTNWRRYD